MQTTTSRAPPTPKPARLTSAKVVWLDRWQTGLSFDWLIALLGLWLVVGIHLDAWAHHQFELESFFTPWHGVLYTGFLVLALMLGTVFVHNWRRGQPWQQVMPAGYQLSLLGIILFAVGGLGDGVWHTLWGIENSIEALISPPHLLLAIGSSLIVTGPLRAAWLRTDDSYRSLFPALLSAALLLSIFTFFTAYANPFSEAAQMQGLRPTDKEAISAAQAVGMAGILLQTNLLMGIVLLLIRRWQLPFGGITLILFISIGLGVSIHEDFYFLPVALLGGLLIDTLIWILTPYRQNLGAFRLFAFLAPTFFYILYFSALTMNGGLWWRVHLWTGAIILSGVVGWLLSFAFVAPNSHEDNVI